MCELMTFQHIIITRFCIRFNERASGYNGPSPTMTINPLKEENLDFRKVLFEAVCFPSMVNQTSQKFDWVILIESDLPAVYKDFLLELTKPHPNFHIHSLTENEFLGYHDWLAHYIPGQPDFLVTTHLDDDDSLPPDFVINTEDLLNKILSPDSAPVVTMGTMNVVQWDMDFNDDFPFGTFSPWHRHNFMAVSCGFTFVGRYPDIRLYILSMLHSKLRAYFNLNETKHQDHQGVKWVREQLKEMYHKLDLNPDDIFNIKFYNLSDLISPVFMTNHGRNLQVNRVHEAKSEYITVEYGQSFGSCQVNWPVIQENRHYFENIPGWKLRMRASFPLKQYLIVKRTIQSLFNKTASVDKPRRPRTLKERETAKRI